MRGRFSPAVAVPHRPPWAVEEALFTHACTRCGACVAACPTGLLVEGTGGFPEADFQRGRCTFCADCVHACAKNARQSASSQVSALAFSSDLQPWSLCATIDTSCLPHRGVLCRSCEDHCEERAIRFTHRAGSPAHPEIIQSRCTGCGECVASCPAKAISMQPFTPSQPYPPSFQERAPL